MSSFRPLPLLGNPHVQTILGNYLAGLHRTAPAHKWIVPLPDGDRVVLHETPPRLGKPREPIGEPSSVRSRLSPAQGDSTGSLWSSARREPIALLVHGLGGSHRSSYMPRITNRLNELGWRVFRMDLRGAGAGMRLARRFYNAACSDDVRVVAEHLAAAFPQKSLAVVGFSLGGNIVLRFAGEAASRPVPSVCAVAAIAPPIDLIRCSNLIARYPLYDSFFVRLLTTQVVQHQHYFPDLPRVVFPRRMILRQFDDIYTAPRWGYADSLDYYRQASAVAHIPAIRLPTFILTARDDPFIAVEPFDALKAASPVEVHITAHGGHLGFLGADGVGGIRWAETQLVNWLAKQIETVASPPVC